MQNGKLIIERKRRFSESRYSVEIYIDGEFVVNTINNDAQEMELSPGKHILKVKQGYRSGETSIEIKKGKITTYEFTAKPLIYLNFAALALIIILVNTLDKVDLSVFYIPFILLSLCIGIISRKKYFVIQKTGEDESWLHDVNQDKQSA